VDDEASTELVSAFYEELRQTPTGTKAQALRQAQMRLMENPRFRHPCYWSPHLVIGSWL
jgi:CHAT domain-containing protein